MFFQRAYRYEFVTRRMAIAKGTCFSFCNQPKAHSGLHEYAPETIAVNVTWMLVKRIAAYTHLSSTVYEL